MGKTRIMNQPVFSYPIRIVDYSIMLCFYEANFRQVKSRKLPFFWTVFKLNGDR
jgi:hypothetical protein